MQLKSLPYCNIVISQSKDFLFNPCKVLFSVKKTQHLILNCRACLDSVYRRSQCISRKGPEHKRFSMHYCEHICRSRITIQFSTNNYQNNLHQHFVVIKIRNSILPVHVTISTISGTTTIG